MHAFDIIMKRVSSSQNISPSTTSQEIDLLLMAEAGGANNVGIRDDSASNDSNALESFLRQSGTLTRITEPPLTCSRLCWTNPYCTLLRLIDYCNGAFPLFRPNYSCPEPLLLPRIGNGRCFFFLCFNTQAEINFSDPECDSSISA